MNTNFLVYFTTLDCNTSKEVDTLVRSIIDNGTVWGMTLSQDIVVKMDEATYVVLYYTPNYRYSSTAKRCKVYRAAYPTNKGCLRYVTPEEELWDNKQPHRRMLRELLDFIDASPYKNREVDIYSGFEPKEKTKSEVERFLEQFPMKKEETVEEEPKEPKKETKKQTKRETNFVDMISDVFFETKNNEVETTEYTPTTGMWTYTTITKTPYDKK